MLFGCVCVNALVGSFNQKLGFANTKNVICSEILMETMIHGLTSFTSYKRFINLLSLDRVFCRDIFDQDANEIILLVFTRIPVNQTRTYT